MKVQANKKSIAVTKSADQHLLNQIINGGDKTGKATEELLDSLARQNGFKVIKGGKYGSNNGFDHVWVAHDASVVVVVESKQIHNGAIRLNQKAAGGHTQMSKAWIDEVLRNLPDNDPAKSIIIKAQRSQKLKKAITGVDRQAGEAMILPVEIPSKSI